MAYFPDDIMSWYRFHASHVFVTKIKTRLSHQTNSSNSHSRWLNHRVFFTWIRCQERTLQHGEHYHSKYSCLFNNPVDMQIFSRKQTLWHDGWLFFSNKLALSSVWKISKSGSWTFTSIWNHQSWLKKPNIVISAHSKNISVFFFQCLYCFFLAQRSVIYFLGWKWHASPSQKISYWTMCSWVNLIEKNLLSYNFWSKDFLWVLAMCSKQKKICSSLDLFVMTSFPRWPPNPRIYFCI